MADKDRTWDAAKKQLLGDIGGFLQSLMDYKNDVDNNKVPEGNFKDVRMYFGSWNEWSRDPSLPIETGLPTARPLAA